MSRQLNMRDRAAAQPGPYGPNNPPPPPSEPPPRGPREQGDRGRGVDDVDAAFTDKKGCFRCGEQGHIARACKVRVGQIKTDAEVAADEAKAMAGRYGDRDDDRHWSPRQDAAFRISRTRDISRLEAHIQQAYGQSQDTQQPHQEHFSEAPSRSEYFAEDEVDWDDDALETAHVAPAVRMSTGRKIPQPEYPRHEEPYRHYEGPEAHTPTVQHAPIQSVHRRSSQTPSTAKSAKEPKLGLPHLQNAETAEFPPTVHDLRGYDYRIFTMYASKPKAQRFINGANGKIAPGMYGSEQRHDLGLCFTTYLTKKRCEMGVKCPWRHHPLSNTEKAWIIKYGKQKGEEFIENVDRWWNFPETPVPGTSMEGLGDGGN
ncbi:hypothetical protein J4E83_010896 [Alternaria metachromatica]|uniref:uncharacterized protein n=1 Tax=Alternaria metachromatica TaxID=283354 RepID=UPI0020C3E97B|nr:uncharacterized protein J4E83_010896 [Alternaria metachromatica]KAI4605025.1 hypothetical protein J4E83_010896 [Alternaria metachromatica]